MYSYTYSRLIQIIGDDIWYCGYKVATLNHDGVPPSKMDEFLRVVPRLNYSEIR